MLHTTNQTGGFHARKGPIIGGYFAGSSLVLYGIRAPHNRTVPFMEASLSPPDLLLVSGFLPPPDIQLNQISTAGPVMEAGEAEVEGRR